MHIIRTCTSLTRSNLLTTDYTLALIIIRHVVVYVLSNESNTLYLHRSHSIIIIVYDTCTLYRNTSQWYPSTLFGNILSYGRIDSCLFSTFLL